MYRLGKEEVLTFHHTGKAQIGNTSHDLAPDNVARPI
jgi:hypothetical protein